MLILKALDWSYDSDLASPPARWSCTFLESGTTAFLPGEAIPKSTYERAAIDVTVDGHTQRLAVGVVREWGLVERPEGLQTRAEGIDLKAVLLDFKPVGPTTYKGMAVASDSTAAIGSINRYVLGSNSDGSTVFADFFHTFQSVARDVVVKAGGTAMFEGYDYYLGQEVNWEMDQSANDILQQMLAPFNVTERFKMDVFFEPNNVVWFKERGRYTPAAVEVDYKRLRQRDVRRSKYPAFNDVQVLGATYTHIEPDIPAVEPGIPSVPTPGLAFLFPYTEEYTTEERESTAPPWSGTPDTILATTRGIRYYTSGGRMFRHVATKNYFRYIVRNPQGTEQSTFAASRQEYTREEFEHRGPHGEMTRKTKTLYVDDGTSDYRWDDTTKTFPLFGIHNFHHYVERDEATWEYDSDGEVTRSHEKTSRAKQPDPVPAGTAQSAGLIVERDVEQVLFWTLGQRVRTTMTKNYDRDGSAFVPIAISTHTEPMFGKSGPSRGASTTTSTTMSDNRPSQRGGFRTSTRQVKAGPDNAQLKYSFSVLGRTEDCEYVRQKISTERRSTRYETTLSLYPDLGVAEGKDLTAVGAPARWEKNIFYLVARSMKHDPDLMELVVRGLAWI